MSYYKNYNYNQKQNKCAYCGENSYKYELCSECYQLAKEEYIIKNENGNWIKNIIKGNEYKFYDETKEYYLKEHELNEFEFRYFNIIRKNLNSKYIIIPQVNLQTIIETNSNKRNDELFRNVDFIIFKAKEYKPTLVIELNGQQHYTNPYWIERDKSIHQILNRVKLPILTIDIKDLKLLSDSSLFKITNKTLAYINPSFIKRLFSKKYDNKDLSWTTNLIKSEIKKAENTK
ncbi:MAG: DUF2726 domain-containing protein [Clostridia bacterium]|nr:DUF2726 domain-containing protein [Clostridia bacterium]